MNNYVLNTTDDLPDWLWAVIGRSTAASIVNYCNARDVSVLDFLADATEERLVRIRSIGPDKAKKIIGARDGVPKKTTYVKVPQRLSDFTTDQLLDEIRRRCR